MIYFGWCYGILSCTTEIQLHLNGKNLTHEKGITLLGIGFVLFFLNIDLMCITWKEGVSVFILFEHLVLALFYLIAKYNVISHLTRINPLTEFYILFKISKDMQCSQHRTI